MDEMPYAGNLGGVEQPDDGRRSFSSDIFGPGGGRGAAAKYAGGKKFRELAEKHYANIPYPVWIAPMAGIGMGVTDALDGGHRSGVRPLDGEAREFLRTQGFTGAERLGDGDLVIAVTVNSSLHTVLGTPWMIFHAMFDGYGGINELIPDYFNIYNAFYEGAADPGALDDIIPAIQGERWYGTGGVLTMASARGRGLSTGSDAIAEMMCQELLTSTGLKLNLDVVEDEEELKSWESLRMRIKKIADDFRKNARGKLLTIAVN